MKNPKTPVKEKIERAPTSKAKCRGCRQTIQQGSVRIGTVATSPRFGPYNVYYHKECCPEYIKQSLRLPGGRSLEDELAHQAKKEVENRNLLRVRADLRESIRRLRLVFARHMDVPAFMVFDDKTLDAIVLDMPRNRSELLTVYGMGEKRVHNFGGPILEVIRFYRLLQERDKRRGRAPARAMAATGGVANDSENDVAVGETLSCEEIVNRRFAEAQQKGEVISVEL